MKKNILLALLAVSTMAYGKGFQKNDDQEKYKKESSSIQQNWEFKKKVNCSKHVRSKLNEALSSINSYDYKEMIECLKRSYGKYFEINYVHEEEMITFIDKYIWEVKKKADCARDVMGKVNEAFLSINSYDFKTLTDFLRASYGTYYEINYAHKEEMITFIDKYIWDHSPKFICAKHIRRRLMETVYAPNTDGYKRMINDIKKHYGEGFEFDYVHEKEIIAFIDKYYYLKYKLF